MHTPHKEYMLDSQNLILYTVDITKMFAGGFAELPSEISLLDIIPDIKLKMLMTGYTKKGVIFYLPDKEMLHLK